MKNVFFDNDNHCYRFINCYENASEISRFRVDLTTFNFEQISELLDPSKSDPDLRKSYRVNDSVEPYLTFSNDATLDGCTCFLEAYAPAEIDSDLFAIFENVSLRLKINCSSQVEITDPLLGELKESIINISGFGSRLGTCIICNNCSDRTVDLLHETGWHLSIVDKSYFDHFDDDDFKKFLTQLGWYGDPINRPNFLHK